MNVRPTAPLLTLLVLLTPWDAAAYPLDDVSRTVPARGKVRCPDVKLVRYPGARIRYHKAVTVFDGFVPRLERFEEVVAQVATAHYGRAPRRIRHLGTYNCRRIRAWPTWISEHGLGNGIDVAAFVFPPLPKDAEAPQGLPRSLRRSFTVTVEDHWGRRKGRRGRHGAFLKDLAQTLANRDDIFRVLLGPGYPGHHDHFHFDCGPYEMLEIEGVVPRPAGPR